MAGLITQLSDDRSSKGEGFSFGRLINSIIGKDRESKPENQSPYGGNYIDATNSKFKPAIDRELDVMIKFISDGKASSLSHAYNLMKEQAPDTKFRDFNLYVGRALKYLDGLKVSPQLQQIRADSFNLPVTLEEVKNYNAIKRGSQGLARDAMQVTYGASKVTQALSPSELKASSDFYRGKGYKFPRSTKGDIVDFDTTQEILNSKIQKIDDNEMIWKAYNANKDPEKPSGIDLPLNIGGGIGESLLAVGTGVKAATAFTTRAQQISSAFKLNSVYEGLRYAQHGNPVEAGVGILSGATDFIPGLNKLPFINQTHGGQRIGNLITSGKRDVRVNKIENMGLNAADHGLHGLQTISDGKVRLPYNILYRPNKTVKSLTKKDSKGRYVETEAQRILNVKKMTDDFQTSSSTILKNALDNIGKSKKSLIDNTPKDWQHIPEAYAIKNYFEGLSKKFKSLAKPYSDAYKEVGDNYRVDFSSIAKDAKKNLTDSSAIAHFNKAYRTVTKQTDQTLNKKLDELTYKKSELLKTRNKDITKAEDLTKQIAVEKETLDRLVRSDKTPSDAISRKQEQIRKLNRNLKELELKNKDSISAENAYNYQIKQIENDDVFIDTANELTANQADAFVKELNQQIYDKSSSMSGAMTDTARTQLGWVINGNKNTGMKGIKTILSELPEDFSIPYNKASKYYKANFDMLDSNNPGSINGLDDALRDGTGEKLIKLFKGESGFRNLQKLGHWMLPDNELYGILIRSHIEDRISPKVMGIDTINDLNTFDGEQLIKDFAGVDLDAYRSLVPIDSKAYKGIDSISGVVGVSSMVGKQMKQLSEHIKNNVDLSELDVDSTSWTKNMVDNVLADMGLPSEFPSVEKPESLFGQTLEVPGLVSEPSKIQKIKNIFDRTRAPDTNIPIYEGPTKEAAHMSDVLKKRREELTGYKEVRPTEQGAPGIQLLNDTPYTPKEI